MAGCVIFLIIIVVVVAVLLAPKSDARGKARAAYEQSLEQLKRDPANPDLRQETLRLGRHYASLVRNSRGVALFDEVALSNDINAACAGAAQQRSALPAARSSGSVESRLIQLSDLRAKGLIDDAELAQRRREILSDV
jgi:Tfp pilus assembly protein PilE